MALPHWVQYAAGGVDRWQVGQRISPGFGVAMSAHCACRDKGVHVSPVVYPRPPMRRINVAGTSCSGKTTLARAIADRLGLPHVELDALFWGPGWAPVPPETFRNRVADALAGQRWVVDGGYSSVRDITWSRVDTVVWLDYPMPVVLHRWLARTARRIVSREEFWPGTGNRESLRNALRRDGLLWWILRTHHRRRRSMTAAMRARSDIRWVRLRSPAAADRWLRSLSSAAGEP
jgi:adenylate kinase family enzyme